VVLLSICRHGAERRHGGAAAAANGGSKRSWGRCRTSIGDRDFSSSTASTSIATGALVPSLLIFLEQASSVAGVVLCHHLVSSGIFDTPLLNLRQGAFTQGRGR
jgi:hypothetical protein